MYKTKDHSSYLNPSNPFKNKYKQKQNVVLLAHGLIGTVRGKSANGLMMHSKLFNVVAIVDRLAAGKDTAVECKGVTISVPIFENIEEAIKISEPNALIILLPLEKVNISEIKFAAEHKLDIINTSFRFIKDDISLFEIISNKGVKFYDLRDVGHQQLYPNTNIINRKAKVVFVTGTDCGLGKRTATFELTQEAKKRGINAAMYATGQTGLMLGERGTVVDALTIEFSNGVVSQHIASLDAEGYELIFVEGQSDIYHPANSAVSLALLHGSNPDCIVMIHDEDRKVHKGFEENSPLYKMHTLKRHIQTLESLSLPCGPTYKTVAIATIGEENIKTISTMVEASLPVSDVKKPGGAAILLDSILKYLNLTC